MLRMILISFMCLALSGCVTNQTDRSIDRVQSDVAERSGYDVTWQQRRDASMRHELIRDILGDQSLDAEEAVRLALANNADLQAELSELGVAHGELMQASLLPNPVLSVSLRFVEGGGGEILEMGVAQSLVDVLLRPKRKALAETAVTQAERRAAATVLDLAAETRIAYRRYQGQLARVELYQSVVDATFLSAEMARRLREAGNVIELDVLRDEAMHEQARLRLAEARAQALTRRESLNALLGLWGKPAADWSVPPRLPDAEPMDVAASELESDVVSTSLDLEIQRLAVNRAAQQAGIEKVEAVLPGLDAGAEAEREPGGEWSVGPHVGVALPIFDYGQGVRAEQAARLRQAMHRYHGLAVRLRAAARATYTAAQSSANASRFLREKLLPLQTRLTGQTQLQFNAMQIGVFQLLSAKRSEIEMAERYLSELETYWAQRIRLETLRMGRLAQPRFGIDAGGFAGGQASESLNNNNANGGH